MKQGLIVFLLAVSFFSTAHAFEKKSIEVAAIGKEKDVMSCGIKMKYQNDGLVSIINLTSGFAVSDKQTCRTTTNMRLSVTKIIGGREAADQRIQNVTFKFPSALSFQEKNIIRQDKNATMFEVEQSSDELIRQISKKGTELSFQGQDGIWEIGYSSNDLASKKFEEAINQCIVQREQTRERYCNQDRSVDSKP